MGNSYHSRFDDFEDYFNEYNEAEVWDMLEDDMIHKESNHLIDKWLDEVYPTLSKEDQTDFLKAYEINSPEELKNQVLDERQLSDLFMDLRDLNLLDDEYDEMKNYYMNYSDDFATQIADAKLDPYTYNGVRQSDFF